MQTKKRKLNKEELELWKLITKDDIKLGNYSKDIVETKNLNKKRIEINKDNIIFEEKYKIKEISEQPIQVNKRMKAKLSRGLIRPEATLDLHGENLSQARSILIDFVKTSVKKNIRCVLIITGKKKTEQGSKGIIRESLPLWLKEKELVHSILFNCYATKRDGADGARYVLLRKKSKVFYD